ncbi:FusB/FusC family EF-G-binding protein [Vallitalea okinawensis]|uniref:FusB/FusC family EF-G-binding protein n=1 Tax=Vallitalea okinawensis TaxID=2078660 RepID=UPI000CFCC783|nr:FusB/FusC family EF-G-binding protein [Vallitalea okinawensis]
MDAFIKKHEYNYIKQCLTDLNNTLRGCVDINIIDATNAYLQDKILNLFSDLSWEQKELLDISTIKEQLQIDNYLANLDEYVYGMPNITAAEVKRLFKKEKKIRIPNINTQGTKSVYLGWIDEAIRKLFVVYNMNGKLIGMACRMPKHSSNNIHICILCYHTGSSSEVAFVSHICKSANSKKGTYRSIGFDICLDSTKCNQRISAVDKLEEILKDVNSIK